MRLLSSSCLMMVFAFGCAKVPDGKIDLPAPSPVTIDPSQIKAFPVTDEDKKLAGYWELQPSSSTENRNSVRRRLKFSIVEVSSLGPITMVDSCLRVKDEAAGTVREEVSVAWYTLFEHKIVMSGNMLDQTDLEEKAKKAARKKEDPVITELKEQTLVLNGKDRYRRFVPPRELKAAKTGDESLCDFKVPESKLDRSRYLELQ